MADALVAPIGWERALMAAEKVKERLRRATRALDTAAVPYAVAGGNAVAEWVSRIDEDAIRNTRDVDAYESPCLVLSVTINQLSWSVCHGRSGRRTQRLGKGAH